MNEKFTREIAAAYDSLADGTVDLAKIIDQLETAIVQYYDGTQFNTYKSSWTQCVVEYFKAIDVQLPRSPKPNWENITANIIDILVSNGPASSTSTSTSSSSSINEDMSANSVPIKMIKLSGTDKNSIKTLYDGLDKTKMWTLSTGTVVEEQMKQFALNREHEHLSHSLILDVNDNCWGPYFTDAELKEIKEFNAVPLPVLPYDVKTYLDELEATASNTNLYNKVNATQFEPNTDCKWIQDSYNSCFRLIKCGFFPLNDATEQGIGKRIWSCLDTCFDFSTIRCVAGEKCSRASADAANIKRSISDLSRQHGGRKMDYLFKTRDAGTEVGCGECGLIAGVNTTKELQDCGFKMPKVMKDMMFRLVLESPGVMNKLCISGVYIGQNVLKLSILDCPAGYVTRYDAFNPVDYPMTESKIRRQLAAVLKMILSARLIMQDAKQKLDDDDSEIVLGKQTFNYAAIFYPQCSI